MLIEIKVPQLSESVAEATLLAWHKKVGEAVKRDENLIDIETDKVVLELPAPADGVLANIIKGDGSIFSILKMDPSPTALYGPLGNFRFALEARAGFYESQGIKQGEARLQVPVPR